MGDSEVPHQVADSNISFCSILTQKKFQVPGKTLKNNRQELYDIWRESLWEEVQHMKLYDVRRTFTLNDSEGNLLLHFFRDETGMNVWRSSDRTIQG